MKHIKSYFSLNVNKIFILKTVIKIFKILNIAYFIVLVFLFVI